ncbi:MAG TPA: protein-glutamate O-methyltransferase CheR [Halobacteria archaeon]|nr:protein-glutamate O-methyltransferase CheR [Halobacteria archaeon]
MNNNTFNGFGYLLDEVKKKSNIDLNIYKDNFLKRRIDVKMRGKGITDYFEYARLLKNDKKELDDLINVITINVTEFMRDIGPFRYFKDVLLDDIIKRKDISGSKLIRIWSAACANGEEPYSIAICASEYLEEKNKDYTISIYGTDIDKDSLKMARRGVYSANSLKNISNNLIKKYFDEIGDDQYKIKDNLADMVRFKYHDLTSRPFSRFFDVVFCRNVIIYFSSVKKREVLENLYNSLIKNGFLILGKTEYIPTELYGKFKEINVSEKIYQRID